jgi:hypothetical protein
MAIDKKTSQETTGATPTDSDFFRAVQDGGNVKFLFSQVRTWILSWLTKSTVGLGNVDNTSDDTKNSAVATLTNKTIAAGSNTIQDLATSNFASSVIDTDGTLAANSDTRLATQKATKTYLDQIIAAADAMVFKGVINCSANPNYPAADRGWTYKVSVAGKIGGASGINVEVGDTLLCITDGTASGTQAAVGAQWNIVQVNVDGAVVGPASATDGTPTVFDGATGKLIKNITYAAFKALLALVKGDVGLGNVDNTSDTTKWAAAKTLTNTTFDTAGSGNSLSINGVAVTSNTGTGAIVRAASPALSGVPTAPTASPSANSTQIATTAYVDAQVSGSVAGVSSVDGQTGAVKRYFRPGGRLTLSTGTPVMRSTVSGSTTIYYTPYASDMVPIFDGTNMIPMSVSEVSQSTTDATKSPAAVAASKVYDVFVWNDSGTLRATRGPAWTNDTTRGYSLTIVNGILLNASSITNGPAASRGTYVGTVRSNASSTVDYIFGGSASGGSAAFFGVWNCYNRVATGTTVVDTSASYTYTAATVRQANGSAGNQISFVLGLNEDAVAVSYAAGGYTTAVAGSFFQYGMGFDNTAAMGRQPQIIYTGSAVIAQAGCTSADQWTPGVGVHVLSLNQVGDGAHANNMNSSSLDRLSAVVMN